MQDSRDSSVLRSLAVAFGDGLAFGVGMKLTQRGGSSPTAKPGSTAADLHALLERLAQVEARLEEAERPPTATAAPAADLHGLLERLNQIEGRVEKSERRPAVSGAAASQAPFDQKVLEAVVTALDARLHEQAGHVETRITELEARLAIELNSLSQQDHSVATGIQTHLEELHSDFNDQAAALRRRADEDRLAVRSEIASLHREFAVEAARALEDRVEEAVDRHLVKLRTELEYKDDQIAELREVIFGIAQACRALTEPRNKPEPQAEPPNVEFLPGRRAG
jgi:hypothetical protein